MRYCLIGWMCLCLVACAEEAPPALSPEPVVIDPSIPLWAKEAIWYEIVVERFRNGDPSNDPTVQDLAGAWPPVKPERWKPTPWTHDWYAQEDWASATGEDFYYTVHLRRYGGDLQGVIDQLDYVQSTGATALLFNPLNDAPSFDKVDARHYRHIDRTFGPDPRGDAALIAAEDPADPATWQWTAADSLFLDLIQEVHKRGMRLIMDVTWGHTGTAFWAWQDVQTRQQASPYAAWYEVDQFDDPDTPENEFAYASTLGERALPVWSKAAREQGMGDDTLHPAVKAHIYSVTQRWLDPNGDGDPSDGVDGFRLRGAETVPPGFWRAYRAFVRSIQPMAYLVGATSAESSDGVFDPAPWLLGDMFDAVLHYPWYAHTRSLFAEAPPDLSATQYINALNVSRAGIPYNRLSVQIHPTASHSTPRFSTSVYRWVRYGQEESLGKDLAYPLDKPGSRTQQMQQLLLINQFTQLGAPHIWYGDEVGMWGADVPDNHKPMVWSDLTYEPEAALPYGEARAPDAVQPDTDLLAFYARLSGLRQSHLFLFSIGNMYPVLVDDERRLLIYERVYGDAHAIVAFNLSDERHEVTVLAQDGFYNNFLNESETLDGAATGGTLVFTLEPLEAKLWMLG